MSTELDKFLEGKKKEQRCTWCTTEVSVFPNNPWDEEAESVIKAKITHDGQKPCVVLSQLSVEGGEPKIYLTGNQLSNLVIALNRLDEAMKYIETSELELMFSKHRNETHGQEEKMDVVDDADNDNDNEDDDDEDDDNDDEYVGGVSYDAPYVIPGLIVSDDENTLSINGYGYKVAKPKDPVTCLGCAFTRKTCLGVPCMDDVRKDGKDVIWVRDPAVHPGADDKVDVDGTETDAAHDDTEAPEGTSGEVICEENTENLCIINGKEYVAVRSGGEGSDLCAGCAFMLDRGEGECLLTPPCSNYSRKDCFDVV